MHGLQEKRSNRRLGVGPLSRGRSAAAIVIARVAAKGKGVNFGYGGVVAVVCFADATSMHRGRRGRQRRRGKAAHERKNQQQSGGQAMHVCQNSEPWRAVSIKQNPERAQPCLEPVIGSAPTSEGFANQARPRILAHHQRTPTNRKRQSWKNSGALPSKAWPTNWKIHPVTKTASA